MVERRKKTRKSSDGGKAAGKKPSRSRKARLKPDGSAARDSGSAAPKPKERPDHPENGRVDRKALKETPQAQDPAPEAPQITLPGELYQRADQWWWRVKLPGEDQAQARPLRPEGAQAAVDDRQAAEKIAFEVWENAIEANAARQIKLESTEKIERLKAQFLDKVRHFTELVETANAKIEAEADARAQAEAKLAQILQAEKAKTEDSERKIEDGGPRTDDRGQTTEDGAVVRPPSSDIHPLAPNPPSAVTPPPAATQTSSPREHPQVCPEHVQQGGNVAASSDQGAPAPEPSAAANAVTAKSELQPPPTTGACECCGATGIATACLTRIDSGQSLCPRCLAALRADVARIESPRSARRRS